MQEHVSVLASDLDYINGNSLVGSPSRWKVGRSLNSRLFHAGSAKRVLNTGNLRIEIPVYDKYAGTHRISGIIMAAEF